VAEPLGVQAPETVLDVHVVTGQLVEHPRLPAVLAVDVLGVEREHAEGEDVPDGEVPQRVLADALPRRLVAAVLLLDPDVLAAPAEPRPRAEEELAKVGRVGSLARIVEDHLGGLGVLEVLVLVCLADCSTKHFFFFLSEKKKKYTKHFFSVREEKFEIQNI
jgi:hypothetical protein